MDSLGGVLITGCSTGIGRATALHLDGLGYRVFATVRKPRDAEALRDECSNCFTPILLDVTDPQSICEAKLQVERSIGDAGLLGLVNNAGTAFLSPLESASLDSVRALFDVHVFGMLAVTQAFLPLLRQRGGRIVNVSSQAALLVAPFHGPYSAAKLAVHGFSDALRRELKPLGVQVSVIIPGSIDTPIWERATASSGEEALRRPAELDRIYGRRYQKFAAFMWQVGREGIDAREVARAVAHALRAKRARHYYRVGVQAEVRLYDALKDIIPGPLLDSLVLRGLGLE